MKTVIILTSLVLLAAGGACGPRGSEANDAGQSDTAASPAPAPGSGMQGMQGMQGMEGSATMQQMRSHMQAMQGASGDSLRSMLPMHRQMAANMLAEMNGQMRQMNMVASPEWAALADSVRQDLVRLPEMGPAELQPAMPAHEARLNRLMGMHQVMMDAGR